MNKSQLVDALAGRTGMSKAAALEAVDGVFAEIGEALARGDTMQIVGFGTFSTRNRPGRTGRNPGTGETVEIAPATVPAFKPGKSQGRRERGRRIVITPVARNAGNGRKARSVAGFMRPVWTRRMV